LRMSLRRTSGYLDEALTARMQHEGSLSATTGIETPSEAYYFGVTFKHVDLVSAGSCASSQLCSTIATKLERACDEWLPLALSRVAFNGNRADRRLRPTVESTRATGPHRHARPASAVGRRRRRPTRRPFAQSSPEVEVTSVLTVDETHDCGGDRRARGARAAVTKPLLRARRGDEPERVRLRLRRGSTTTLWGAA
jgi:hypothetical protein